MLEKFLLTRKLLAHVRNARTASQSVLCNSCRVVWIVCTVELDKCQGDPRTMHFSPLHTTLTRECSPWPEPPGATTMYSGTTAVKWHWWWQLATGHTWAVGGCSFHGATHGTMDTRNTFCETTWYGTRQTRWDTERSHGCRQGKTNTVKHTINTGDAATLQCRPYWVLSTCEEK